MSNKILNIVSVLEEGKLACIKDRKTLRLEYSENTISILKRYIEHVYKHDFDKQCYFKMSINTIYNISNHIRESFYFHPTHSVFSGIEIEGDYFISLAKLFNLVNDIRKYILDNALENIHFYVEE